MISAKEAKKSAIDNTSTQQHLNLIESEIKKKSVRGHFEVTVAVDSRGAGTILKYLEEYRYRVEEKHHHLPTKVNLVISWDD